MRIKKVNNHHYCLTKDGYWVRDFKNTHNAIDINRIVREDDYQLFLNNEIKLKSIRGMMIDDGHKFHRNIVIVSNGYKFSDYFNVLKNIDNATIIGVNGALKYWDVNLYGKMDYYLTNNPYEESILSLPKHGYYPPCIMSTRSNIAFAQKYRGMKYKYVPTCDEYFAGAYKDYPIKIDEYRNPICAAISISYMFSVEKLLLLCCDDVFQDNKPSSISLGDGLWMYPHQEISKNLIDANLFWLCKDTDTKVANLSCIKYQYADNISKEQAKEFFENPI